MYVLFMIYVIFDDSQSVSRILKVDSMGFFTANHQLKKVGCCIPGGTI